MRILLTGIGGFIGSHFLSHLLLNTGWEIVGIDSWNHKGLTERITDSKYYHLHRDRVSIYTHDLGAPLSRLLKDRIGKVDYIVNLASDSHVDRSISDPVSFIQNNVNLVINVLEYAREVKPEKFVQIGTDESYGATFSDTTHKEWDSILPSNPYSASKACQEAIAISYWRTFGVPVILTNTMNNFGEMQDSEKFVPMVIKKVLAGEVVKIHANRDLSESGSRYWLHARNHADAVLFLLNNLDHNSYSSGCYRPDRFNIVGERRVSNLDLAKLVASYVGKELKYELIDAHTSRPGHDLHYGLDGEKLKARGWKMPCVFEESLRRTVEWTLDHPQWL